ncbi:MAG: L,D-transpeptidase family protein [Gemmatimonadota bacterium]|nr:MAG: L,D-transpeptidase family protein [Gemmatimonadota bacterium]
MLWISLAVAIGAAAFLFLTSGPIPCHAKRWSLKPEGAVDTAGGRTTIQLRLRLMQLGRHRVRPAMVLGLVLLLIPSWPGALADQQIAPDPVAEGIRRRVEVRELGIGLASDTERIFASDAVPRFYLQRTFRPAWSASNRPLPIAATVVKALQGATEEGLDPSDYHLARIRSLMAIAGRRGPVDVETLVDLDLMLTDAFLVYGAHLLAGRVNPETIDPEWHANRREMDFAQFLERAVQSGDPAGALRSLLPEQEGYHRLKQALNHYRAIAAQGGWQGIEDGPSVAAGQRDQRIPSLQRRLALTGDLKIASVTDPMLMDEQLTVGLKQFQSRHGLDSDGVLGAATLAALNIPVEERIRQIALNLERWRWLPQDLGDRHIVVNIAAFELEVFEGKRPVLTMPVIVGRPYRRTPVFSSVLSYLVFSPYWHVPHSLAIQDQLPMQQRDPEYFRRTGMRVFDGWGAAASEVDPSTIDWTQVGHQAFRYRLRQDPGPANALGGVKFMFPNKHSVYLHDTPARDLFAKSQRDFSSGCIRVGNAAGLADYLLRDTPPWDGAAVRQAMNAGVERTVPLASRLPVHILYWTAWANEDGSIHFRRDLYGRDDRLAAALFRSPS